MRIAVVGCGVAGQAAATFLSEAGHAVWIFERFAAPQPLGAGLLLQPTGLAVLAALGVLDEALAAGERIVGLEAKTRGGRKVLELSYADLHPTAHGLGIRRGVLFNLLHDRLAKSPAKLVTDSEIVDVDGQNHIVDKNGRCHGPFELIVVADGAHSALRGRLIPEARAPVYPWGCVWTTVQSNGGPYAAGGLLRQRVHGTQFMMGLLPVGRGQLTIFWSLPIGNLTPDKPIDMAAWARAATTLWPEAASIVEEAAAANDFARATYRHVALPPWNDRPILFVGDAAHGTSPQLGQGANLALMDAWTLAHQLEAGDDLATALSFFSAHRQPVVRFYRQASHLLTPFFQSHLVPLGWFRDALMGWSCHLPMLRRFMTTTLAGLRRGWLTSGTLDENARYRL